jgi:GT2 family glycosyltransferase
LLNSFKGVKIGVLSGIKVIHKSIGEVNDSWKENRLQFEELFKDNLPYNIKPEIYVENLSLPKKIKNKVSIIIPTLEKHDVLKTCINSIKKYTKGVDYEILIADTGSEKETLDKIKKELCCKNVELHEFDYYHFGRINNEMVKKAKYPLILFCNNDIELLNDGISKMAEIINSNKDAGTLGARLHYPDGTIQHGGVFIGLKQRNLRLGHIGIKTYYQADFKRKKDIFGNTAAFLMIKKSLFNRIGGFIEHNLSAFEDVILNVECIKQNKKNIYCGDVVCLHHESLTRGASKNINEAKDMKNVLQPYLMKNMRYVQRYVTAL